MASVYPSSPSYPVEGVPGAYAEYAAQAEYPAGEYATAGGYASTGGYAAQGYGQQAIVDR